MIRIKTILAVLVLCVLSSCGGGSDLTNDPALSAMVETKWHDYAKTLPAEVGGVSLYLITPKGDYFSSTGIDGASIDTHFRIASNTKTFTASAIMLLAQDGKLNLDDYITDQMPGSEGPYVPDAADYAIPDKDKITIRQLLSHRAGVFDVTNNLIPESCPQPYAGLYYPTYVPSSKDHQFSFDELVGVVATCSLTLFEPGSSYSYSNTGFSILGKIIERVSGMNYQQFIEQRLIRPNDLDETTVPVFASDKIIPSPNTVGYSVSSGVLEEVTEDNMSLNIAEGNLISTPRNLGKWIRSLINGEAGVLSTSVQQMTECVSVGVHNNCYGLGISKLVYPNLGYGHSGAHNGYLSVMMHDPDKNVTIIVYSNVLNFDDVVTESNLLNDIAYEAKTILGYGNE